MAVPVGAIVTVSNATVAGHNDFCRRPLLKWAQQKDKVFLTVLLPDAKDAKVNVNPEGVFTFSALAGAENHQYELKLDLFEKVNVEESIINVGDVSIYCVIVKAEKAWWKNLLRGSEKPPHYLKVDWDRWSGDESEDDDNEVEKPGEVVEKAEAEVAQLQQEPALNVAIADSLSKAEVAQLQQEPALNVAIADSLPKLPPIFLDVDNIKILKDEIPGVHGSRSRPPLLQSMTYESTPRDHPGMGGGSAPGGMPGMARSGIPGMGAGGMPGMGAGGMPDMSKILNDPELMAAFEDPEVMSALQDVMKNPANMAKHQSNPRVAPIIAKMMSKFSGPQGQAPLPQAMTYARTSSVHPGEHFVKIDSDSELVRGNVKSGVCDRCLECWAGTRDFCIGCYNCCSYCCPLCCALSAEGLGYLWKEVIWKHGPGVVWEFIRTLACTYAVEKMKGCGKK